jgi:hypothetical protein
MLDMNLGCLSGHEIISCMVQWTLDGKDPEVRMIPDMYVYMHVRKYERTAYILLSV